MAQTVKRLPAMRETQVRSLDQEDLLEKEMAIHSSTLTWKIPWMEEFDRLHSPWGLKESDTTERLHFMLLGSSAGKESTCNAGDPSSISGLGCSPGEGIVYPLQYSWASLVAQMVKNLPAMQETWV